jgi:hypothetical protein
VFLSLPFSCVGWGFSLFDSTGNLEQRQTDLGLTSRLITTDQKIPEKNMTHKQTPTVGHHCYYYISAILATYLAYKH